VHFFEDMRPIPSTDAGGVAEIALAERPRSLVGNVMLLFSARALLIILSVISTPVLLHRLGIQAYGVYVLALTFGGLLALLDLGVTPALVSFLSHAHHVHDDEASQRIVSTAFALYLTIGIVGGGLLLLLVPWMVSNLLHVPAGLRDSAMFAIRLSTVGFALNMWLAVFYAIPYALERYDLISRRTIGLGLLSTIAVIFWALHGGGIRGLVLINVVGSTASIAVFVLVSRALLPRIHFRPGVDLMTLRALARFSSVKFAGSIGGILTFRFDQFAIGALVGVGAVGVYAIPSNLALRVQSLMTELASPLFPRASTLRSQPEPTRSLFVTASRAMALVAVPVLTTLFVYADLVLAYWIGGAQGRLVAQQATPALRWLLAAYVIQAMAAVPAIFCEAQGRPEINNGFAVASALIHVPLVLLLVPRLGIVGAAIALFLNGSLQTIWFIVLASRRIAQVGALELVRRAFARPILAGVLLALAAWAFRPFIQGRLSLAIALLATPMIFYVWAVLISVLTGEDLGYLAPVVQRFPRWLPGRDSVLRSARVPGTHLTVRR
jgi:O-antigen/teichoic acid export membrane protein